MKKRVLIFCDFYPPAQGGGGMFAVVNIVDRFSDRYDFFVVAGNRIAFSDDASISGLSLDVWQQNGNARVFYTPSLSLDSKKIGELIKTATPDLIFLNSVFSRSTIFFLKARRRGDLPSHPVIIAPCGELLPIALAQKALKKRVFLSYAKLSKLYDGLTWRASFESERQAIAQFAGPNAEIVIAPDLTPASILPDFETLSKPPKSSGAAQFIFVARVVKLKNLHFLLECLQEIIEGSVELSIVGPAQDLTYWAQCRRLIATLPANIVVDVVGAVDRDRVLELLVSSHYFVLPTLSENFGYVFLEALAAGCPLLISDRTDWESVESAGAGWVNAPTDRASWIAAIRQCLDHDQEEYQKRSAAARGFALDWLSDAGNEEATAHLFEFALGQHQRV